MLKPPPLPSSVTFGNITVLLTASINVRLTLSGTCSAT